MDYLACADLACLPVGVFNIGTKRVVYFYKAVKTVIVVLYLAEFTVQ